MTTDTAELTPHEKKCLRDRRAQRVLREKREKHIKSLEDRVALCNEQHGGVDGAAPSDMPRLLERIRQLQAENQMLLDRQKQMFQLTQSWIPQQQRQSSPMESPSGVLDSSTSPTTLALPLLNTSIPVPVPVPITQVSQLLSDENTSPQASIDPRRLPTPSMLDLSPEPCGELPFLVPAWTLTPSEDTVDAALAPATSPWLTRPDLVAACPPEPNPLDLLHGTRRNYLADSIHRFLRSHHCRDPEVLAMGWLVYIYSKWVVRPTRESYERMPPFMRPVLGQLRRPHPQCLDQIVWPQLQVNLIEQVSRDRLLPVTELLSCCLKVRWKWGRDVLQRDADDVLRVKKSFVETFMSVDGWGITSEFIEEYPELLAGMDVGRLVYTIT
ncbi:hypothetical protein BJX96DRAFT_186109 [Aspergillus floccosus]